VTGFVLGGGQAAGYGTNLDGVTANTTRALQSDWVSYNAPSIAGTNAYHGSAYDFVRNEAFDANNFFNNGRGIPRAAYKQHDFGASAGGPVWIPKIYNGKNRTFFFWSYEGCRNWDGPSGYVCTVPTAEMYDGDFHNWVNQNGALVPIYDPTSQTAGANNVIARTPFAGNIIPKTLFDPV